MKRRIPVLALLLPLLLACASTNPPEEPEEPIPATESTDGDGTGNPGAADTTEDPEGESLDDESFWDSLFDDEDDHLDLSDWLDQPAGFLPLAIPITEPAVGAGLVAGLVFFHPNEPNDDGEPVPPSVTAVFGGATTNGTWMAGGGHMGVWYDDHVRYVGGAAAFNVNLKFYGLGEDSYEQDPGLDYSLKGWAIFQDIRFRVPETDLFLGVAYTFVNFSSEFDFNLQDEGIPTFESTDDLADVTLIAQYDARDNTFTPTNGFLSSAKYHIYDEVFGSDFEFTSVDLDLQVYFELAERLLLGSRAQYGWGSEESPFSRSKSFWKTCGTACILRRSRQPGDFRPLSFPPLPAV